MRKLVALAIALGAGRAEAYCPSYTASSPNNTHNCAIEARPGTDPTIEEWNQIFARVAGGPATWGEGMPAVAAIRSGCDPFESVPARYPCELLKAIGMAESGWKQFCVPDRPADQVGGLSRTIISFDCGYGVSQVTSGMHVGESPPFDREKVAGDAVYNLATGAKILADKWRAVACVGGRDPSVIEHWYTATWAYNGLSYTNNPNNPNFSSSRGVWNPSVGGAAPYQEKVFGWMEHTSRWPKTQLAYPALGTIGNERSPGPLPEPECASPTDCTGKRPTHRTSCGPVEPEPAPPDAGIVPSDPPDAGIAPMALAEDVTGGCGSGGGVALLSLVAWRRRR